MLTLHWLPEAHEDLKRLHTFIASHNPNAANRAIQTLVQAASTLREFPEKGRPWEPEINIRELTVRFGTRGYVVRYRVFEDNVFIIRVWHGLENR